MENGFAMWGNPLSVSLKLLIKLNNAILLSIGL
jgi:hypothetical protein